MPRRYVSGLDAGWGGSNPYAGRFLTRFLVEWLSQVVGWTIVDLVGSLWNNVAASGGTCQSTTTSRLEITSPSYVFSSADEGGFLTITGFASPYEARDGIYKIRRYIGAVGTVYTVEVDIRAGVHSDGLPVGHTGLDWRFWKSSDTYCPNSSSDIAVLEAIGTTGASLTNGTGTGDSFSLGGTTITFTDAAAQFVATDVGKTITIAGATTPGNNGSFVITSWISATQITYENASGATEAYSGTWTITYKYQLHITAGQHGGWPGLIVSPWGSWNAGTHTWDDNRHTAMVVPNSGTAMPDNIQRHQIWATADEYEFFLLSQYHYSTGWILMAAGEMDAFYPEFDPRPCWCWLGNENYYSSGFEGNYRPFIGLYSTDVNMSYYYGLKGLGLDDVTSYTFYLMLPHVPSTGNANWIWQSRRKMSGYSRMIYRLPILTECRTANNQELRGTLRNIWACCNALPPCYPQGASGEFMHCQGGLMFPWNGSKCSNFETGRTVAVG